MDGIHDLGGRHGFGSIDVDEQEIQFHEPYEARVRCMINAMTQAPDWSKDWFRHCRELIDPADYLTRPYFDQWIQAYGAMLVNSGLATVEELATGKSAGAVTNLPPPIDADAARAAVLKASYFDTEISAKPRYAVGDSVHTVSAVTNGHTRLPGYARNRTGIVIAQHGAHIYPDAMAVNEKRHVHLYTIEFPLSNLWPEVADTSDVVTLDLWETYLEPK